MPKDGKEIGVAYNACFQRNLGESWASGLLRVLTLVTRYIADNLKCRAGCTPEVTNTGRQRDFITLESTNAGKWTPRSPIGL